MSVARSEDQVLLCIARRRLDPEPAERLRELLQKTLDWDYLLAMAERHCLIPLLHFHLTAPAASPISPDVMSRLQDASYENTRSSLSLTGELIKVFEFLGANGIRAIPFKGPTLAMRAYGDVGLRQFGDLDVLVPKRDVPQVKRLLVRRGFSPTPALNSAQQAALLKFDCAYNFDNGQGVVLDVHWSLVERHSSFAFDPGPFWDRLETVTMGGKELLTLSTEDLLLVLCLHGFTHVWERLGWICDVASLIDQQNNIDWRRVLETANKLGLRRILMLGLLLAGDLLDASIPAEMRQAAGAEAVVKRLAHQVQENLFVERRPLPGLFEGAILNLRMRERKRDRIGSCLRLILTPRSYDWMSLSLPESLFFLYYLLRPVRLARKYGLQLMWDSEDRRASTAGDGLSHP